MKDCIFCQIAEKKAEAHILFENEIVIVFLDIDPISDGHLLIIPKNHIRDIHTLDSKTGAEIMRVAKEMSDVLMKSFNHDGIMLMEVNGMFQDVPHFHLHVFGRNKDNDIKFNYPEDTSSSKLSLQKNAEKIRINL